MAYDDSRFSTMLQGAGTVPAIASIDAVAVYDSKDGRVVHLHHAVTFEGAEKRRDRESQQKIALETAKQFGHSTEGLDVLYVADFEPSNKAYRVDLKSRTLVGEPVRPDTDERAR